VSGFWPDGNAEPDPPLTLDQAQAAARVLQHELGLGWRVKAEQYPEGARLEVRKWPKRDDDRLITAPSLKEARKRLEREGG
jgi:hypothetical protein